MHLSSFFLLAGAALAGAQSTTTGSAPAATHSITVGGEEIFSPSSLSAAIGDSVVFTFESSSSHSVLQADFARPCEAKDSSAIFSGLLSSKSDTDQFVITINDTSPLWYFCSVGRHCQGGMVGVINPPTGSDQTIDNWEENSGKTTVTNAEAVQGSQGGVFASSKNPTGKTGSGTGEETTAGTATETAAAAASSSSSQGAAATVGPVLRGEMVAGLGGLVAVMMI